MKLYGLKKISSTCSDLHEAYQYSLEQLIQKGKNSVRILKAYSHDLSETVAIKLFPKNKEGRSLNAFRNEKKMLSGLTHANILQYYEIYNDAVIEAEDGNFVEYSAIIMEYVSYGDLYGLISQKPFSEKLARSIFKQMISVMQYLHNQDLIHLDLKLENFLITPTQGVKLIDFESCHDLKKGNSILAKGTLGYRAPEILQDHFEDPKALDVYSLGVVLFMMVSGTPPYVESKEENGKCKYDRYYEALHNDSPKFWRAHEKYRAADRKEAFTQELKEMVEVLLNVDVIKRPKIGEIRRIKWFQGEVYTNEELEKELKQYFRAS